MELLHEDNIFRHVVSGLKEEAFVQEYFSSFRLSLYITRLEASISHFRPLREHLQDNLQAAAITVHDRVGNLGVTFSSLGNVSTSTVFRINPSHSNYAFSFERSVSSQLATAFSPLQGKCKLLHILTKAIALNTTGFSISQNFQEVLSLLQLLERTNSIVFTFSKTALNRQRSIHQNLGEYFIRKALQEVQVLILHDCIDFSPLASFRNLSTSVLCKSHSSELRSEQIMHYTTSLNNVDRKFDFLIVSNRVPQPDLLVFTKLVHVGTVLFIENDLIANKIFEMDQVTIQPLFSWASVYIVTTIKQQKSESKDDFLPSINEDPQFQHLKYLGFDDDFVSNFQQRNLPLVTSKDVNPKIKDLEETRSNLQHLLKALKEKNFNASDGTLHHHSQRVETEDEDALWQLTNHSFKAQRIPLPNKNSTLHLTYRRKDCWG